MTDDLDYIFVLDHKKREKGELKLHFFAPINPKTRHQVFWFMTSTLTKSEIFAAAKDTVRKCGDELFIFDGVLYQYDYGSGKFIKQRWENVEYDI